MTVKFERTIIGIPTGEQQELMKNATYVIFDQSLLRPKTTICVGENPSGLPKDDVVTIQTSRASRLDKPIVLYGDEINNHGRSIPDRLKHGIYGFLLTSE